MDKPELRTFFNHEITKVRNHERILIDIFVLSIFRGLVIVFRLYHKNQEIFNCNLSYEMEVHQKREQKIRWNVWNLI